MANKTFVVEYLIKAREQFVEVANKTRAAATKMRESIKKVGVTSKAAAAKMKEDWDKAVKSFVDNQKRIRDIGKKMTLAVTTPLLLLGYHLKNVARDADETDSKFNVVFSSIIDSARKGAKGLADSYGLAQTESKQLLSDTGDLLTGFGFSQKAAFDLSLRTQQLAVDLASFTNYAGGAKGASEALTKAMLGEREQLKMLGVVVTEQGIKTKILQLMGEGRKFASLQQAKAEATLAIAVEQSKNAIGDFARTQAQLANQERITSSRFRDLKESFGRILLPIALKLTKAFRVMVEALLNLSPETKKLIVIFAGMLAVAGPLIFLFGTIPLIFTAIAASAAKAGIAFKFAFGPWGLIIAGVVAGAMLLIDHWGQVKTFFEGFALGLRDSIGPTTKFILKSFTDAATAIAALFAPDAAASKNLKSFSNIGQMVGNMVGKSLEIIFRGLAGVGETLGQLAAAVANLDFSQFDVDKIVARFEGTAPLPTTNKTKVEVGVNVGLEKGLKKLDAYGVSKQIRPQFNVGAIPP